LFDTFGTPYVSQNTATSNPAGGPGPIIQPLPTFNFSVYDTTTFPVTPGVYNVGVACTVGNENAVNQLDKYWNNVITITADPADPGPAKVRFVVGEAPGAPTNVTAVPGNMSATVSFTAPASNGGSPITSYTVTNSRGAITAVTANGTTTTATVTGLTNGTPCTFTVQATNVIGTGPASAPSTAVTPANPPGAPTGVTAVAGNGSATVSFTAPASNLHRRPRQDLQRQPAGLVAGPDQRHRPIHGLGRRDLRPDHQPWCRRAAEHAQRHRHERRTRPRDG